MISTKDRLERGAIVLAIIDERRRKTGNRTVGSGIERFVINRELSELKEEILANPGALEVFLVRRK